MIMNGLVDHERTPPAVLERGVESLAPWLRSDGTLHDPVFATPTQYGSAYFGWCCAVLAEQGRDADANRQRAAAILAASLAHTADTSREPFAAGFDRATLSIASRLNHRDFTWPPILKTLLSLENSPSAGSGSGGSAGSGSELRSVLAAVEIEESFRSRPPSNWAAVWMSGEWLRMQEGLSPTKPEQFDDWLETFFKGDGVCGFDLDLGMYLEHGLPNPYDLFTRAHFTDLLLQGYCGRNRERLESFLTTGLRRSLIMQLSDGSMASGFRSTGQTWVLGAQIALFTGSRVLGLGSADESEQARLAAWRAFDSLARWQRPNAPFSPVQNLLDPRMRVGYEGYTADGHYSSLALAFLASAISAGFGTDERPSGSDLENRPTQAFAEGSPTWRGVLHSGRVSAAVQTQADGAYDGTGIVDLTFGPGRLLQFVSSARQLGPSTGSGNGRAWLNPGLAVRPGPGATQVSAVCGRLHKIATPLRSDGEGRLTYATTIEALTEVEDDLLADQSYRCDVAVTTDGVDVTETTPGALHLRSLLIPYPRNLGTDARTTVSFTADGVRLQFEQEWVEFTVAGAIERAVEIPYGYENRRGLCGLVRLDLTEPAENIRWSVRSADASDTASFTV